MAVPADIHDQISRMEARLRLVPPDETPPPDEVRERVRTWQKHVHEAAVIIRWADEAIGEVVISGEAHIVWRRIGTHAIFEEP